ncbi:hypothetical protein FJ950_19730 [Mesorhizobium sp. B2-3-14]|nr:hypothetical protein [Mesorhizobium sp. B2-3-14]TPL83442.1 hypothetical protein FJ950_19730 [Mesorhizobium sp. B2-3-14]
MLLPHPTDWPLLFYGDPWLTSRSPDRVAPQRHDLALAGYLDKQAANREAMNRRPGLLGRLVDKIRQPFGKQAVGYDTVALEAARSVPDAFRELAEKELCAAGSVCRSSTSLQ